MTIEKMKEYNLTAMTTSTSASNAIFAAKRRYDEQTQEVRKSPHFTAEGRGYKISQIRSQIETELKAEIEKLRTQYDEATEKARETAREILTTTKHPEPSDGEKALFERELTDLKTKLMLEIRYNSAMQLISEFEQKYADGYYATALLDQMPAFIEQVVALADNKDEARTNLRRMYSALSDRAKTDEQREAEALLAYDKAPMLSRAGAEYRVLIDIFGAYEASNLTQ